MGEEKVSSPAGKRYRPKNRTQTGVSPIFPLDGIVSPTFQYSVQPSERQIVGGIIPRGGLAREKPTAPSTRQGGEVW